MYEWLTYKYFTFQNKLDDVFEKMRVHTAQVLHY